VTKKDDDFSSAYGVSPNPFRALNLLLVSLLERGTFVSDVIDDAGQWPLSHFSGLAQRANMGLNPLLVKFFAQAKMYFRPS
jgi:hypothetical protein